MKGSYVLIIEMKENKKICIGKREYEFKKGFYAYVGSALNSLEKRIERHLKKHKKMRWHIDYLLKHAEIKKIYYKEGNKKEECDIANRFSSLRPIKKFGSSDCKCISHLFYSKDCKEIEKILEKDFKKFIDKL